MYRARVSSSLALGPAADFFYTNFSAFGPAADFVYTNFSHSRDLDFYHLHKLSAMVTLKGDDLPQNVDFESGAMGLQGPQDRLVHRF